MSERAAGIVGLYGDKREEIVERLAEFSRVWDEGTDWDVFRELAFCLFTPQSKARSCWMAIELLTDKDLLFEGASEEIASECNMVRFRNNKARYLVEAREAFKLDGRMAIRKILESKGSPKNMRDWLMLNVKGMGYKEASHFLRNIGKGGELAILDRHILKNLLLLGVVGELPKSLPRKRYLDIEEGMQRFSRDIGIPMDHLDMVLWHKEAGELFK